MRLVIDASAVSTLQALWARAPDFTREELLRTMAEVDLLLEGELKQTLPAGAGGQASGLRASVFSEEHALADNVIGLVASTALHSEPVEMGSNPHFPPLAPLLEWVRAKLGLVGSEARSAAFLIGRKISRKGTKADGSWRLTLEANTAEITRKFEMALVRISARLAAAGVSL